MRRVKLDAVARIGRRACRHLAKIIAGVTPGSQHARKRKKATGYWDTPEVARGHDARFGMLLTKQIGTKALRVAVVEALAGDACAKCIACDPEPQQCGERMMAVRLQDPGCILFTAAR